MVWEVTRGWVYIRAGNFVGPPSSQCSGQWMLSFLVESLPLLFLEVGARSQTGHEHFPCSFLFSSWLQYNDYEQKGRFFLKQTQTVSRGNGLMLRMS